MVGAINGVAAAKSIPFAVNPMACEFSPSVFDAQECVALEGAPVIVVPLGLKAKLSFAGVPVLSGLGSCLVG